MRFQCEGDFKNRLETSVHVQCDTSADRIGRLFGHVIDWLYQTDLVPIDGGGNVIGVQRGIGCGYLVVVWMFVAGVIR